MATAAVVGGGLLLGGALGAAATSKAPSPGTVGVPEISEEERGFLNQNKQLLEFIRGQIGPLEEAAKRQAGEESQFRASQIGDIQETKDLQRALEPALFESLGFTPEFDSDGKITSVKRMTNEEIEANLTPLQREHLTLATETTQRQIKALRGELDADPNLENEIKQGENELRASLARRLGADYENTTVGSNALNKFNESAGRLRFSSREGIIAGGGTLTAQASALAPNTTPRAEFLPLFTQGRASLFGAASQAFSQLPSPTNTLQAPSSLAGGLSGLLTQAQQPFQFQRRLATDVATGNVSRRQESDLQTNRNRQEIFGSVIGAGGAILGGKK